MTTLLDAGPLVAILNAEDAHHEWAVDHARRLGAPFLTCEAVLSEAHFLLQDTPGGRSRLIEIAESDRLRVPFSYTAHAGRVHDLVRTYSDLPASSRSTATFGFIRNTVARPFPCSCRRPTGRECEADRRNELSEQWEQDRPDEVPKTPQTISGPPVFSSVSLLPN